MAKPLTLPTKENKRGGSDPFDPLNFNVVDEPSTSPEDENKNVFEATASRDLLGPPATNDPTATSNTAGSIYRWNSLQDSKLKGPRRSVLWDVVTNYQAGDQIDAPDSITTTEIMVASGSIRKLNAGLVNSKGLGGKNFLANTAAAFTYEGPIQAYRNGVFLVLNDGRAGYQQTSDALIFLQGFSFDSGGTISFLPVAPAPAAATPA